jgi:hypothetical protein
VTYTVTALDGSPKDYTVVVKVEDQAVGISIDLVNDDIVGLFGLTSAEASKTVASAKGIELSVTGTRREAVISLTGFSNSATNGTDVQWVVDSGAKIRNGVTLTRTANVFTIKASDYTIGRHWVEVTGTKDGVQYSKTFYFTVDK